MFRLVYSGLFLIILLFHRNSKTLGTTANPSSGATARRRVEMRRSFILSAIPRPQDTDHKPIERRHSKKKIRNEKKLHPQRYPTAAGSLMAFNERLKEEADRQRKAAKAARRAEHREREEDEAERACPCGTALGRRRCARGHGARARAGIHRGGGGGAGGAVVAVIVSYLLPEVGELRAATGTTRTWMARSISSRIRRWRRRRRCAA